MGLRARVAKASSRGGQPMRAADPAWPLSGGTIGDVSTTSSPGRLRGHDLLCAVAEGTAGAVGDAFLRGLVRHVAEAFGAKMVMVAEAVRPHRHARRGRSPAGTTAPTSRSRSSTTPPAALRGHHRVPVGDVPRGAGRALPGRRDVVELGLQSYLAVCLKSSEGVHLGHLAVLDSRPMEADEQDATALRIFAARAGAELERRNQERAARGVARAGRSRPPTRSAAASGATCTTAPSSGCSRSRTCCASRR